LVTVTARGGFFFRQRTDDPDLVNRGAARRHAYFPSFVYSALSELLPSSSRK
jgi:hypothetical protein